MVTCKECNGDCCRILVVEIPTPETKDDFEDMKWYLYHPGISLYIDMDDAWNVQYDSKCKHLSDDGKCMIYENRPPVCRDSPMKECHRNRQEVKVFFDSVETYEKWMKKNVKL